MATAVSDTYVATGYDVIPYDIQASAIDFAESVLYKSVWDYVFTLDYNNLTDTYTYTLYYGSGLRTLSGGFDQCKCCIITYDVDHRTINRNGTFTGSERGVVVGIEGGAYNGTVSGSLLAPCDLYTVTQSVAYTDIDDGVTFDDADGVFYTSIEGYAHLKGGYNYADFAQGGVMPCLLGAVCVGVFIQIFRRFG